MNEQKHILQIYFNSKTYYDQHQFLHENNGYDQKYGYVTYSLFQSLFFEL